MHRIEHTYDGKVINRELLDDEDRLHSLIEPASLSWDMHSGILLEEGWYKNGGLHRKGGDPAYRSFHKNGITKYVKYAIDGEFHNIAGPAYLTYFDNGQISSKIYYINGLIHNLNSPARINYNFDGKIIFEMWAKNNKCHRVNGPATTSFNIEDGSIIEEKWFINSKYHNTKGAAHIYYGKISFERFYIDGIEYKDINRWEKDARLYDKQNEEKEIKPSTMHVDGCFCRDCDKWYPMAVADGPDGKLSCYVCKNKYVW